MTTSKRGGGSGRGSGGGGTAVLVGRAHEEAAIKAVRFIMPGVRLTTLGDRVLATNGESHATITCVSRTHAVDLAALVARETGAHYERPRPDRPTAAQRKYKVESDSGREPYTVTLDVGGFHIDHCTCPSYHYHGRTSCKHIERVRAREALGIERSNDG